MVVLVVLLFIGALSLVYYTLRFKISPMPSSSKVKRVVEQALPTKIEGKIYELGCGWGTLAFRLAAYHPEAEIHAYEVSPLPWLFAYFRARLYPYPNFHLYWEDFFRTPLTDAKVVVCYLYPGAMERLKGKFEKELPPGTVIVSNTFAIPGWEPVQVIKVDDLYRTKVYVYLKGSN